MPRLPATAIFLASLLLAGFIAATGSAARDQTPANESPAPPLRVKVNGGLLSVDARDAPLADVLRAVGEQTGIQVTIHSGGATRVTESFAGVRVDEGIQRLAGGYDVVLIYAPTRDGAGRGRLVEVRVYEASTPTAPVTAVVDPRQRAARLQAVRDLTRQARQQQPGALAALAEMLAGDADPVVRQSAAAALGLVGSAEAVSALTAALGDRDPSVRARVVSALGRRRDEGLAGTVAQVLAGDPDASVRRAAVWALSTLRSEDAHRGLQAAASDSDAGVRQAAAVALKRWEQRAGAN
jgi:hypothetical protein